ncbi:hypothetical protein FRB91_003240 [Serendipita sp. 411]|nr:hypothetical protein FRB91_003240 [Serendipita sp. 411]
MSTPLLDAYIEAVCSIDSSQAFCDRNLPSNSKLSASMRELTQAIGRDRNYLEFLTNREKHQHRVAALLSTLEGLEALRDLTDAVKAATDFVTFTKIEKSSDQGKILGILLNPSKAFGVYSMKDEEVDGALQRMKTLMDNITKSSKKLTEIWSGLPGSPYTSEATEQYARARLLVVATFQKHYFTISSKDLPRDSPSLGILNRSLILSVIPNTYSKDPIFQDIEIEGRKWARVETKCTQAEIDTSQSASFPRRALHSVADRLLDAIQTSVTMAAGPVFDADQEWKGSLIQITRTMAAVQESLIKLKATENQRRIAVCGRVKAGKSSTLNALIGRELLAAREDGCTVWPTLIRNDPWAESPVLIVEEEQFSTYLAFLQKWNFPELTEIQTLEAENFINRYNQLSGPLKDKVEKFSQRGFKFPHKSKTEEEIKETIADISDILRACYQISPYDPWILPEQLAFPILNVKFEGYAADLRDIELLDLPGMGDSGIGVLGVDATYSHALASCHGAIFVSRATQANVSDDSFKASCETVRQVALGKPIAFVGTHSDSHKPGKWLPYNEDQFARTLFPEKKIDVAKKRVHYCSPALFFGAKSLSQKLDELEQTKVCLPSEDELCNMDENIDLLSTSRPRDIKVNWDDPASLRNYAVYSRQRSATEKLAWHIHKSIILELKDEEYSKALEPVKNQLLNLWRIQEAVLRASREKTEAVADHKAELKKQVDTFCGIWYSKREQFSKTASQALSRNLDEAESEARAALKQTVEAVSVDYKPNDKTVSFASPSDATGFLVNIAKQLTKVFDKIQQDLVNKTRAAAEEAWKARILDSASYLRLGNADDHAKLSKSLENLVINKLDELSNMNIADKLASLVEDKVAGPPGSSKSTKSLTYNRWRARSTAMIDVVEQINDQLNQLEHNGSLGPIKLSDDPEQETKLLQKLTALHFPIGPAQTSQTPVQTQAGVIEKVPSSANSLNARDAESLHEEGINYLGFLVRAPVPGSTAQCPITKRIWPFLSTNRPHIEIKQVVATYEKYMLNGWRAIVEKECRKSLDGAITLSSLLGMLTVIEAIEEQDAMLEDIAAEARVPLAEHIEERIILAQANYVGAHAAADELCTMFKELREGSV